MGFAQIVMHCCLAKIVGFNSVFEMSFHGVIFLSMTILDQ